jgi:hypothetical protein
MLSTIGNYEYYETPDNQDIYYVNLHRHAGFFITGDKTIINGSRYYSYHDGAERFAISNQNTLNNISDSDLENAVYVGDTIISICKWFVTYGHFMDEAFNLCDFQNKLSHISTKVLLDYHTDNLLITNYPVYSNYKTIDDILFDGTSVNAYSYGMNILKMKKLYLVKHAITDPMFHAFPEYSRNKILSKIITLRNTRMKLIFNPETRLFITRNTAKHMHRNLDNETQIEEYLHINQYIAVNPEQISFEKFIGFLHKANRIVMTWGGALTNMCYCSPNTHIIILKSKSYEHENLRLFETIIRTYKLNVSVVSHKNNSIEIPFLI